MTEKIFKDWTKEKKQMPFDMAKHSTYSMKDMIDFCKYASEKQLLLHGVVKSLPSKELIISEAVKYQDEFLDDPHSIADEAFIEGCNFILTALQEEKVIM